MIALLQGQVYDLLAPMAVIMTANGVGYEVELALNAFCQLQLKQTVTLWTHLVVREDAQLLYGFLSQAERDLFRVLLKVNGVGAKMALAMMSTLSLAELHRHIQNQDEHALTKIPGVGKKTAQRLIVELTDKLTHLGTSVVATDVQMDITLPNDTVSEAVVIAEVEAALVSLGYRDKEAQAAIKVAREHSDLGAADLTTQSLLKLALRALAV